MSTEKRNEYGDQIAPEEPISDQIRLRPGEHISREKGIWRIWGRDKLGVYSIELGDQWYLEV